MSTLRPLKEGNVRTYQEKVALGHVDILASEMDADLDTIYAAWNVGTAGGPAGGDLAGSFPNPTVVKATTGLTIPKDSNALVFGTQTNKGRLLHNVGTTAGSVWTENQGLDAPGTGWVYDDLTRPSWYIGLGFGDRVDIGRTPAGGVGGANLLSVDYAGNLTTAGISHSFGPSVIKTRLASVNGQFRLSLNDFFAPEDPAQGSWDFAQHINGNNYWYWRAAGAAGGAFTTPMRLDSTGHLFLDASVTALGTAPVFGIASADAMLHLRPRLGLKTTAGYAAIGVNPDATIYDYNEALPGYWMSFDCATSTSNFTIMRRIAGTIAWDTICTNYYNGDLRISGANAVKATGTTWANPSDARLKRNVEPYLAGLAEIQQLQPIHFQYNGLADTTDGRDAWGYAADDVAPVFPECVDTQLGKLNRNDADEVPIQIVDPSNIQLAVVNAIKELAARVMALEAR